MLDRWFKINQKIRFLLLGGLNTLLSFLLYSAGIRFSGFSYGIVLTVTYIISVNWSIASMRYFVFRGQGNIWREYVKAWGVYLSMLLLNYASLWLMIEKLGWGEISAQLVYTVVSTILVFYLHRNLTFRTHK